MKKRVRNDTVNDRLQRIRHRIRQEVQDEQGGASRQTNRLQTGWITVKSKLIAEIRYRGLFLLGAAAR